MLNSFNSVKNLEIIDFEFLEMIDFEILKF